MKRIAIILCALMTFSGIFAQTTPAARRAARQAKNATTTKKDDGAAKSTAPAAKPATPAKSGTAAKPAGAAKTAATPVKPASKPAQKSQVPATGANGLTQRALISFPTQAKMGEDVVWRRDIYREIDLTQDANSGLYYPVEPVGSQMNLFTYMFKLMLSGQISAYEYRLDGNESFEADAKVKPLAFMDNYHIYYERKDGKLKLDNSDIPSREVKSYYIKECSYYDQNTATFHTKVIALCPIMSREDDFGEGTAKYPLFWVKYDDIAPFLSKQIIMTSNLNNASTMSVDDYFVKNKYKGKIYKTNNMLGQTLAQYCPTDSAMEAEQKRIENELIAFEKNVWYDQARKDTLDSIAAREARNAKNGKKAKKVKTTTNRRGTSSSAVASTGAAEPQKATTKEKKEKAPKASSSSSNARVSVRRQRH